jgi:drug/metabolite transporter (DMT)-like permease
MSDFAGGGLPGPSSRSTAPPQERGPLSPARSLYGWPPSPQRRLLLGRAGSARRTKSASSRRCCRPTWTLSRVTIGAVVLLPLALHRGALRGLWQRRGWLVAFAALEMAAPFFLIAWGERYVASSSAAILVASLPVIVAVLALRFDPSERLTGYRLVGLAIGIGGVVLLVGIDFVGRPLGLLGAAAILVATCCYAGGSLIVKLRLSDLQPLWPVAVALGLSSLMLVPSAWVLYPSSMPPLSALASIGVLGLVCSAVALVLYFALITEVGPGRATVIGYATPIVAVILGVALLDERLTAVALMRVGHLGRLLCGDAGSC